MYGESCRRGLAAAVLIAGFLAFVPKASAQPAPAFDVASVKVLARPGVKEAPRESIEPTPGSLTMRSVSLVSCIRWAYGVKEYQISGPAWISADRYDIVAKAAGPAPEEELRRMLQSLLADRFKLALRRETKNLPVYALVVGKSGPKLDTAKAEGKATMNVSGGSLVFHNTSMAELADRLSVRPFGLDHPVLDKTGLTEAYDFSVKVADSIVDLKRSLGRGEQDPSAYSASLQDLGLKLEGQKAPMQILVVEHADKLPAEN